MADLTKNIKIGVDSSGVKTGVQEATNSIQNFGKTVQNESSKSKSDVDGLGKSVSGLGPASEKSTKASERAFSSWSAQVKKAAVEIQAAGDKVKEFELKAQLKGFSADAYKPQIDSLRQVIAEQEKLRASNINVGMSAAQMTSNLRMVPAQLTDIVVSLQSGQQPMTVLLQQGGQLKDMFGGVGAAAKALGGYVLSLVNPFSLVAAGVAALAVAYNQGSKENDAFVKSIALTGNASGVTTSQLREYARQMDSVSGTQSKAAASLAEFVSAGVEGGEQLKRFAQTAIDWEKATGQAVGETAKQFADLQKDPLKAVLKLNEGTNFLTASVYEQIKALNDQGRSAEASRVAMDALDGAMRERSKTIQENLGYIEKGWNAIKGAAKGAWDAMLGIGRPATIGDQLAKAQSELEKKLSEPLAVDNPAMRASREKGIENLRKEIWALTEKANAELAGAVASEESAKATQASIKWQETLDQHLSKSEKLTRALTAAREDYSTKLATVPSGDIEQQKRLAAELAKVEAGIRDQYKESGKGPKSTQAFENEIAGIRARIDAEKELIARIQERGAQAQSVSEADKLVAKINREIAETTDKRTKAAKELALAEAQKFAVVQNARIELEKQAKAQDEAEKSFRKYIDGIYKSSEAIGGMADQQDAANASFGKSKVAIAEMAMEQAKLAALNAKDMGPWSPEQLEALQKLASEHERYVESLKKGAYIEASRKYEDQYKTAKAEYELQKYSMSLLGEEEATRNKLLAIRKSELALEIEIEKIKKQSYSNDPTIDEQRKADLIAQIRINAEEELQGELSRIQNQYITEQVNKYGDIFRQGFADFVNNGSDGLKAFGKSLKTTILTSAADALYKAFAQKFVVNVVASLSGGGGWIDSLLGLVGMASGGSGGGGNNWLGMASNANTAYNAYTGQGWAGQAWNYGKGALGYGGTAPWTAAGVQTSGAVTTPVSGSLGAAAPGTTSGYAAVGWAAAAVIAAAYLGGMFKEEKQVGEGLTGDLGGDMYGYQLMRESGGLFDGPDYRYVAAEKELADAKARLAELQTGKPYEELGDKGAALREREMQMLYNQMDVLERNYRQAIDNSQGPIKVLQDAYTGMRENTAAKADSLGLDGDSIRAMKVALGVDEIHPDTGGKGLQLTGLTQEEASKKIQEALAQANEELARSVLGSWEEQTREVTRVIFDSVAMPSDGDTEVYGRVGREVKDTITEQVFVMSEFVREGEAAVQALDRMSGSLVGVNNVFDLLGGTLVDASLAGADWASTLVDAIGGMDALTTAASSYFDLYYSDEEKRAAAVSRANKGMEGMGLDLRVDDKAAKDQYRKLMDDAIAAKEEELIAQLMQFASSFSAGVDAVNAAIQEKADELVRIREETVSTLGLSMDGLVDGFITEINEGRGAQAGEWLADTIAAGFEQAIYGQAMNIVMSSIIDGVITPVVTAAMTGSSISAAVSGAAIDTMVANARAAADALVTLLNDPTFRSAMDGVLDVVRNLGNEIGGSIPVMSTYKSAISSVGSTVSGAAKDMSSAAANASSDWTKFIDTIGNEIRRLRGELIDSSDYASTHYESQFAILTAQARAGDTSASEQLPGIVQKMEEIAKGNASSLSDVQLSQSSWLASLQETQRILAGMAGAVVNAEGRIVGTGTGASQEVSSNKTALGYDVREVDERQKQRIRDLVAEFGLWGDVTDRWMEDARFMTDAVSGIGIKQVIAAYANFNPNQAVATTTGRVIQTSGNTAVLNALQSSSDNPAVLSVLKSIDARLARVEADQRSLNEPQVVALIDIAKTNKRMQMLQEMEAP